MYYCCYLWKAFTIFCTKLSSRGLSHIIIFRWYTCNSRLTVQLAVWSISWFRLLLIVALLKAVKDQLEMQAKGMDWISWGRTVERVAFPKFFSASVIIQLILSSFKTKMSKLRPSLLWFSKWVFMFNLNFTHKMFKGKFPHIVMVSQKRNPHKFYIIYLSTRYNNN